VRVAGIRSSVAGEISGSHGRPDPTACCARSPFTAMIYANRSSGRAVPVALAQKAKGSAAANGKAE